MITVIFKIYLKVTKQDILKLISSADFKQKINYEGNYHSNKWERKKLFYKKLLK